MKELTIEQKALAYDEAIIYAKKLLKTIGNATLGNLVLKNEFKNMFPTLGESEDERIINLLKMVVEKWNNVGYADYVMDIPKSDILAWLEKQREQKSADTCDSSTINGKEFPASEKRDFGYFSESGDKIEPKFHEGQWITLDGWTYHIEEVSKSCYKLSDINGNYTMLPHYAIDDYYRLWTIEDAKAGDVLVCKGDIKDSNGIKYERICLFNSLGNDFFTLTKTSNYVEEYDIDVNIDYPDNTIPATKEQKEILFMAMKEAGYEWDADKKELKKIEPKKLDADNCKSFFK